MIAVSSRSYSPSASGTPPAVALVPGFLFLLRLHRLHRLHRLNRLNGLWRRGDAQRDAASGRGQLGRQLGLRLLLRHLAASEAPEASAASAAAASPSEASEAPAALPSRASLSGTSWVKQEWAEAARAERAGCVRRAGSSRTASSGPARCSWETAEDSPAWARWARRWEP